ncbi:MAG: nucleotide sugar dehydrogenase [Gemmataceae bacterium]
MISQLEQSAALRVAINNQTALVGIIGLGYVGLPLARGLSQSGFAVLGFDVDQKKIDKIAQGESYIGHIPDEIIQTMRENRFDATADFTRLDEADVILICVPTPLSETREPDLTYVVKSTEAIANTLRPGQLIILESTTYPSTTRHVMKPILDERGLEVGKDYFLAYSPEREDPGNPNFTASSIPKVVGGIEPNSLELATALYEQFVVEVVKVSTTEVAEACKILENTYRAVNIALVNELKMLYDRMGVDVWEVIEAAKTKPFGFQAFYPGPGLGGHCIPIDPFYLTWVARKYGMPTQFIELAGQINTSMPQFVIHKLTDALNDHAKPVKGSKIGLFGMAYKKNVDDPRESPGFELLELLLLKGAEVTYNDPHIPTLPRMRKYPKLPALESQPLTPEYLASLDCILIVTDHDAYDWESIIKHAKLVVDSRNATKNVKQHRERIVLA